MRKKLYIQNKIFFFFDRFQNKILNHVNGEKLGYLNLYVKYAWVLLDKTVNVSLVFPSVCSKVLQRLS